MKEQEKRESDSVEEPLLVQAVDQPAFRPNTTTTSTTAGQTAAAPSRLASDRQIHGAMWAGGVLGFVLLCGPWGALFGVWAGHALAKHRPGPCGRMARRVGDFTARMGARMEEEWEKSSESGTDDDEDVSTKLPHFN